MKPQQTFIFLILFFGAAFGGTAFAESLKGTINSMDPDKKSLEIVPADSGASPLDRIKISIEEFARSNGYAKLDRLDVGDKITVEIKRNNTGNWEMTSLALPSPSVLPSKESARETQYLQTKRPMKSPGRKSNLEPVNVDPQKSRRGSALTSE